MRVQAQAHQVANATVSSRGEPLPHITTLEHAFPQHRLESIRIHPPDRLAAVGARGMALGEQIAAHPSDLHTVAHEVAHVLQQRANAGGSLDAEARADRAADRVVQGQVASHLVPAARAPGSGTPVPQFSDPEDPVAIAERFPQERGHWDAEWAVLEEAVQRHATAKQVRALITSLLAQRRTFLDILHRTVKDEVAGLAKDGVLSKEEVAHVFSTMKAEGEAFLQSGHPPSRSPGLPDILERRLDQRNHQVRTTIQQTMSELRGLTSRVPEPTLRGAGRMHPFSGFVHGNLAIALPELELQAATVQRLGVGTAKGVAAYDFWSDMVQDLAAHASSIREGLRADAFRRHREWRRREAARRAHIHLMLRGIQLCRSSPGGCLTAMVGKGAGLDDARAIAAGEFAAAVGGAVGGRKHAGPKGGPKRPSRIVQTVKRGAKNLRKTAERGTRAATNALQRGKDMVKEARDGFEALARPFQPLMEPAGHTPFVFPKGPTGGPKPHRPPAKPPKRKPPKPQTDSPAKEDTQPTRRTAPTAAIGPSSRRKKGRPKCANVRPGIHVDWSFPGTQISSLGPIACTYRTVHRMMAFQELSRRNVAVAVATSPQGGLRFFAVHSWEGQHTELLLIDKLDRVARSVPGLRVLQMLTERHPCKERCSPALKDAIEKSRSGERSRRKADFSSLSVFYFTTKKGNKAASALQSTYGLNVPDP
mgnify:CR=1 FL=1